MEVIVLAGGLGTRLQFVLHEIPKCLAPVGDKPFLGWLLEWLGQYPVTRVVFSLGHLREQVMDYVQSREWPFEYDFAIENTPLGTGGGIRLALEKCRENQVFVINGDTFYPVDLNAMPFAGPVSVALKPMRNFDRYGAVSVTPFSCHSEQSEESVSAGPTASENGTEVCSASANKNADATAEHTSILRTEVIANPAHTSALPITAFHEKQPCAEGLINGGVYAIDRSRLDLSSLPEKFSFEKEILVPLAAAGKLAGWVSDAYFIDIGIPEDYQTAQWSIPAWFAVQKAFRAVLEAPADTLFLDRDGVLNRHLEGDYVKSWDEWEWMPGVLEALAACARNFSRIVLVTNQRGVGRGVMSDEALAAIHQQMLKEIQAAGGRLDLVLVCTATQEEDPRRKPNIGMYLEACSLLPDIDPEHSVMVGDSPTDALFAARCGMAFISLEQ